MIETSEKRLIKESVGKGIIMEKEKYLGPIVDTHSHFMPATDDGSESMEMTMEMLRMAEKEGVTDLFFTFHGVWIWLRYLFCKEKQDSDKLSC